MIEELISKFDDDDEDDAGTICARFDAVAFVAVLQTLLLAEPDLPAERGIYR